MCSSQYELDEKLYYYVDKGDLKTVNKLLSKGANAAKISSFGRSPIGQATIKGFSEILEILLKSCEEKYIPYLGNIRNSIRPDSDIEHTPDGMEGLLWDDEIYQQNSTSFTMDDEWSRLYLYYARIIEETGEILANSVKYDDPHSLDLYNQAPIHYAAYFGHIDCLNLILNNGSPVDLTNKKGMTPLHLGSKSKEITEILLNHKADPNRKTYNKGETPLHAAVRVGVLQVVELLVDAGADINATNNYDKTPLMVAILFKKFEIAYYLINKKAKLNVQDVEGKTALFFAVSSNHLTLASYLLKNGARLFVTHSLLHLCVREDLFDMAKLLVNAGENINGLDFYGNTPLLLAIKLSRDRMVEFLLKSGAQRIDSNQKIRELHYAVQNIQNVESFSKIARILLSYGVSIDEHNNLCETPVMLAITLEKYNIAEFLIKEGANINIGRKEYIFKKFLFAEEITVEDFKLLSLLVNSGLSLNSMPLSLKPPPLNSTTTSLYEWLAVIHKTPRTLKSICRISIRNCLIKNLQSSLANTKDYNESKLKQLIRQTDLPVSLQEYIYELKDLPNLY